jgi:hypothetical protein
LLSRLFLAGKLELRVQFHARDRQLPVLVFLHVADGLIGVFVEHELLFAGNRQEREHVAARERSDKRFLGIDIFWIPDISRRGGRLHFVAAVEFPSMIARIFLVFERRIAAFPTKINFMFGHTS